MKLLKYIPLLLLVFTFSLLNAQDENVKDPKAKVILDKLAAKNKAFSTVTINFSYNLSNKDQNINETQKGVIRVKGSKYKIKLDNFEIISDGNTKWMYMKEVNEVQIENAVSEDEEASFLNPSDIFTMHEKDHKYKYKGKDKVGNQTYDVIKLFPENASDKPYHTIILYIDDSNQLHEAEIMAKDGNKYTYRLEKVIPNLEMKDSYFIFDTSIADDVIDLR